MKAIEYTCGCITHPTRGPIRYCGAKTSHSLRGNPVQPNPELEGKHAKENIERTYVVGY